MRPVDSRPHRRTAAQGRCRALWSGRWSCAAALASVIASALLLGGIVLAQVVVSPVQPVHLQRIRELFQVNGLTQAAIGLDRRGRVELQGVYDNELEVDRAFSLAQTVVGVRWVSPVTPERIRVRAWMSCLESLLAGRPCDAPTQRREPVDRSPEGPPGPLQQRYALVVGIGRFQDSRIQPLRYAAKDAADVYRYLIDPAGGDFPPASVALLQDAGATRTAVVTALERITAQAGTNDLVFVYLSSHGTPPDKYGGVHLVTFDAVVKPREQIWHSSLSEDVLRAFIQEVRAKRLIIILDACYSNGAYTSIPGFLPQGGKSLDGDEYEGYGRSRRDMAQRLLGMKDLVYDATSSADPPNAVRQGWGKVLISASDAGERSWESDQLRNSIFTHYFLQGLVRTRGSVKAAFEYSRPLVQQQVQREKGRDIVQSPQATPSRVEWDISVASKG